eukprot:TRINITY_DN2855_c0_g2_i1.p1 TRINITY_DN2855_c0_g2~~TRINITY_DN2855_c0_g2_i1.p1  ORF type:complete len:607 (+),score=163.57 TRINITY_DN2855_c0_g2_i1:138-1823(+)
MDGTPRSAFASATPVLAAPGTANAAVASPLEGAAQRRQRRVSQLIDLCRQEAVCAVGCISGTLEPADDLVAFSSSTPSVKELAMFGQALAMALPALPLRGPLTTRNLTATTDCVRVMEPDLKKALPPILVQYDSTAFLRLPPHALNFWEKIPAMPVYRAKKVRCFMLSMTAHANDTYAYVADLNAVWQSAQLGHLEIEWQDSMLVPDVDLNDTSAVLRGFAATSRRLRKKLTEFISSMSFCVVFVVNPLQSVAASTALRRCLVPLLPAVIQVVPAVEVLSERTHPALRELALTVYNKCRFTTYSPAYVVDVRAWSPAIRFLHCAYALSADGEYFAVTYTDSAGTVLESQFLACTARTKVALVTDLLNLSREIRKDHCAAGPVVLTVTTADPADVDEWVSVLSADGYAANDSGTAQANSVAAQVDGHPAGIAAAHSSHFDAVCVLTVRHNPPVQLVPLPTAASIILPPASPPRTVIFTHNAPVNAGTEMNAGTGAGMAITVHHALQHAGVALSYRDLLIDIAKSFHSLCFLGGLPLSVPLQRQPLHLALLARLIGALSVHNF